MRTNAIRVIEKQTELYNFLEIQFLSESFNYDFMGSFDVLGSITFQQNKGETNWYGLTYVVNTHDFGNLDSFNRMAKAINKKINWNSQPEEVIEIINGRQYFLCNQEFFKISDKGKYCFNVMSNGSIHSRLVARSLTDAENVLNKTISKWSKLKNKDFFIGDGFKIV